MIHIPLVKSKDKYYFWEGLFVLFAIVVFLAALVLSAYAYLFAGQSDLPLKTKSELEVLEKKPYVYPEHQLRNVIKDKLLTD